MNRLLSSLSPTSSNSLPGVSQVVALFDSLSLAERKEISERSYIHDNGFAKIVICDYPDGSALRLHVWMQADAGADSNIHSHRWSFKSAIICGEIEQSLFDVSPGGPTPSHHYEYQSSGHGREYSMSRIGSATPTLTAQFAMTPGFTYILKAGAYHSVAIRQPVTATIVLTGPAETEQTYVLTQRHAGPIRRSPNLSVTELTMVTDALRRSGV